MRGCGKEDGRQADYNILMEQSEGRRRGMGDRGSDLAGKKILVVSDDAKLSRAIELNLGNPGGMQVVCPESELVPWGVSTWGNDDIDLLVVATSSPSSEPVVMLARAALTDRVGLVPLLIISDRPFVADSEARIDHLAFPFCPVELYDTVSGILKST